MVDVIKLVPSGVEESIIMEELVGISKKCFLVHFLFILNYMGVLLLLAISPFFILYVAYTQTHFRLEVKLSIELGETCVHQTPT